MKIETTICDLCSWPLDEEEYVSFTPGDGPEREAHICVGCASTISVLYGCIPDADEQKKEDKLRDE